MVLINKADKRRMMKNIMVLFIFMLLLTTAVPAVKVRNIGKINPTTSLPTQVDSQGDWFELQKLFASDGERGDNFGERISISGDTVLIGAPYDDDAAGSVYVFIRIGIYWTWQAKFFASDSTHGDEFGWSVSLDGNTALIGATQYWNKGTGAAYVFVRDGNCWTQEAKLIASDGTSNDAFGASVAVSGNTALIGAPCDASSGSVYVFTRYGTTWFQEAKLLAGDGTNNDMFGRDVSLSGDIALIGAPWQRSGSAYVFARTGITWMQQAKLCASGGDPYDKFGWSVSLNGKNALIGAPGDSDKGNGSGSAYVFMSNGASWTQQQKLLASDGTTNDTFGYSVALDRDTAFIGAPWQRSGSAYVFARTGITWTQEAKLIASDGTSNDIFGYSVALDRNTAFIGAPGDSDNGINSGSAYIFKTTDDLDFEILGGLGVNIVITNNGTKDATNVTWIIHTEGGIFQMIHKTVNGTIDVIKQGKSKIIRTGLLCGFGTITITTQVADNEKTAIGKILLFFVYLTKRIFSAA